jgi:hypothetical protein
MPDKQVIQFAVVFSKQRLLTYCDLSMIERTFMLQMTSEDAKIINHNFIYCNKKLYLYLLPEGLSAIDVHVRSRTRSSAPMQPHASSLVITLYASAVPANRASPNMGSFHSHGINVTTNRCL